MASMDLDSLTDSEIRAKFLEYGENIGPVTATTRKLYIKKLRSLINQNGSFVGTSNGARQSSEDESDGGSSRGRRSMGPPKSSRSPTRRKSPSRSQTNSSPAVSSTLAEPVLSKVTQTTATDDIKRSSRSSFLFESSSRSQGILGGDDASETSYSSAATARLSLGSRVTRESPPKFSSPDLDVGLSDAFKSRLQASGSTPFSSSSYTPSRLSSSQPYASDFVRSLSARKSGVGGLNTSLARAELKETDDDEVATSRRVYERFTQGVRRPLDTTSQVGKRKVGLSGEESWLPFDSPVSTVLLLVFSLFFVILGITYVNMHTSDTSLSTPSGIHFPLCSTYPDDSGIPKVNCIKDNDKDYTEKIFNIVYNELHERLKSSPCNQIGNGPFGMSDMDLQSVISEKDPSLGPWITQHQLANVKILINANPQLKLVDITGGIALINPPVPLFCFVLNNLSFFGLWVLKIVVVLSFLMGLYVATRYWLKKEASHKREVYELVNNIIEIVGSRANVLDNFVPITHVRDQLIAPQDRQRLDKLWRDAVKILESDSRVRCEQAAVEGEECLVWRWVATASSPLNTSNKRKTWQGQAFDTMEGSVNSLPSSPTSCLKIRHMFDAALEEGDDWVGAVTDAILEKTSPARVLHIAIEPTSREGCVYIKCATPSDAGIAYRALHGSWFDSKLVTVKYIREARYLERFPDSAHSSKPLIPYTRRAQRQPSF